MGPVAEVVECLKMRPPIARLQLASALGPWARARQSLSAGERAAKPPRAVAYSWMDSRWARRYRDLIAAHVADLGGADILSEAQLSLIKRASAIELELEQAEGKLSMGEAVDLDSFTRAASHLRRLFEVLGLARRGRDVTLIDGTVEAPWSPMRERLRAEAAVAAKEDLAP
jgi:hypothetical protein